MDGLRVFEMIAAALDGPVWPFAFYIDSVKTISHTPMPADSTRQGPEYSVVVRWRTRSGSRWTADSVRTRRMCFRRLGLCASLWRLVAICCVTC